jgi:bifunctional non-homologous end joining protein LigD
MLDGEAVVAGADGIAVFGALHRRHKATDAMLYAFDLLDLDGKDIRTLPLAERKAKLAKLLARAPVGIVFNEHTDEDGAVVFLHACKMGLEGIVSKRLTAPYRSGPSRDWLKVKNPDSPAMLRAREHFARLDNDAPPLPAAMDRHRTRRILLGPGRQRSDGRMVLFSD